MNEKVKDVFHEKTIKFQEAVYNCQELKGLVTKGFKIRDGDANGRFWIAIFDKIFSNKADGAELRVGGSEYSLIFLFDHVTCRSICIKELVSTHHCRSNCVFANYFPEKEIVVAQFSDRLSLYKIDFETFTVTDSIDCFEVTENGGRLLNGKIERVVLENSGLDYFSFVDDIGKAGLVQYNWKKKIAGMCGLYSYMIRYNSIFCLYVKELNPYPVVILGVQGKLRSDTDWGYAVFVHKTHTEESFKPVNFKNSYYPQRRPNRFMFSEINEEGSIFVEAYINEKLLERTVVPLIMEN